ncbi:hypothetical protein SLNHY_5131 [Streptomyces albus]|nr:hypothetical protein SLNHY_5131 [Streptomyces albus]
MLAPQITVPGGVRPRFPGPLSVRAAPRRSPVARARPAGTGRRLAGIRPCPITPPDTAVDTAERGPL